MAGKVQRTPLGFLRALGMVGSGVQPSDMRGDISPVIDMLPFYGGGMLVAKSATGNVQNAGDKIVLTVPTTEQWVLLAITGDIDIIAAEYVSFSVGVELTPGSLRCLSYNAPPGVAFPAGQIVASTFVPYPIVLKGGNGLFLEVDTSTLAVGRTAGCRALVMDVSV